LLANIYLHYVLDLWVQLWRRRHARGDVIIVRWADDFVVGFQYEDEASRFKEALRDRLKKFSLELHPEKTRLIRFGRFARRDCERFEGRSKPETFNFLVLTHFCGVNIKGKFIVGRITQRKRLTEKLHAVKAELRERMHQSIVEQRDWLVSVIRGGTLAATPFQETGLHWVHSVLKARGCGTRAFADAVRRAVLLGTV